MKNTTIRSQRLPNMSIVTTKKGQLLKIKTTKLFLQKIIITKKTTKKMLILQMHHLFIHYI